MIVNGLAQLAGAMLLFNSLLTASALQGIAMPCEKDSDCVSQCCGFNSGLCSNPIIRHQELYGGCGRGEKKGPRAQRVRRIIHPEDKEPIAGEPGASGIPKGTDVTWPAVMPRPTSNSEPEETERIESTPMLVATGIFTGDGGLWTKSRPRPTRVSDPEHSGPDDIGDVSVAIPSIPVGTGAIQTVTVSPFPASAEMPEISSPEETESTPGTTPLVPMGTGASWTRGIAQPTGMRAPENPPLDEINSMPSIAPSPPIRTASTWGRSYPRPTSIKAPENPNPKESNSMPVMAPGIPGRTGATWIKNFPQPTGIRGPEKPHPKEINSMPGVSLSISRGHGASWTGRFPGPTGIRAPEHPPKGIPGVATGTDMPWTRGLHQTTSVKMPESSKPKETQSVPAASSAKPAGEYKGSASVWIPKNPEPTGANMPGNRQGQQYITGACFYDADCASGCCAKGLGVCLGHIEAAEKAGGCGYGGSGSNAQTTNLPQEMGSSGRPLELNRNHYVTI